MFALLPYVILPVNLITLKEFVVKRDAGFMFMFKFIFIPQIKYKHS